MFHSDNQDDTYKLKDHRHRFATWCAATAARSSPKCRFKVHEGVKIVEPTRLKGTVQGWHTLPEPAAFDVWHAEICEELKDSAKHVLGDFRGKTFTHGVAAKFLNCYLKTLFICVVDDQLDSSLIAKRNAIHPPIDRVLLTALKTSSEQCIKAHKKVWQDAGKKGWSCFNEENYQSVIKAIRDVTDGELWKIERFWKGYQ